MQSGSEQHFGGICYLQFQSMRITGTDNLLDQLMKLLSMFIKLNEALKITAFWDMTPS